MTKRTERDKFALVIYSALREWNLQPTMEECAHAVDLIKNLMADRLARQLPKTFKDNTQTKG